MTQNQNSDKEIILSLSKKKGDFIVTASRGSGPGGQNKNKRDTKIRITHPASGANAECQTYRTQEKNRREAFKRLCDSPKFKTWLRIELAKRGVSGGVKEQAGPTGGRGEKIRTYNLVRDEVIDHRIGLHVNDTEAVLNGNLDEIILKVKEEESRCRLAQSDKK